MTPLASQISVAYYDAKSRTEKRVSVPVLFTQGAFCVHQFQFFDPCPCPGPGYVIAHLESGSRIQNRKSLKQAIRVCKLADVVLSGLDFGPKTGRYQWFDVGCSLTQRQQDAIVFAQMFLVAADRLTLTKAKEARIAFDTGASPNEALGGCTRRSVRALRQVAELREVF